MGLPVQLTTFVGREQERTDLKALLAQYRLVTVTGPGGSGKTRLALQVAMEIGPSLSDGPWLAELAAVTDPAQLIETVAATLPLRSDRFDGSAEMLYRTLADKRALLLLDNCEHLTDATAILVEGLLRHCPQLTILTTSRALLGAEGEVGYPLLSMALPAPESTEPPTVLAAYDAVRLFLERAKTAAPGVAITDEEMPRVIQICRRLDGLPLSIELATARLRTLSLDGIAARLERLFPLLAGGGKRTLPRHQTLRATIDWSYGLLEEAERRLWWRLAVFAGTFTLADVEAVCAGEGLEQAELFDLVCRLVDRSLIVVTAEQGSDRRYRLLESIRQYGLERLHEAGEESLIRRRHLDWFARFVHEASTCLSGPDQQAWLNRLEAAHENLLAALRWAAGAPDCYQTGLQMAGELRDFWDLRGYVREGRHLLSLLLARSAEPTPARAVALNAAGCLAVRQAEYAEGAALLQQCLVLRRQFGDAVGAAATLCNLGWMAMRQRDLDQAEMHFLEAIPQLRSLGERLLLAKNLNNLGAVSMMQGEYDRAETCFDEALSLRKALGDERGLAITLRDLGSVAYMKQEYRRAAELYQESQALVERLGDKPNIAVGLNNLGLVAQVEGRWETAKAYFEASLTLYRDLGDGDGVKRAEVRLADLAIARAHAALSPRSGVAVAVQSSPLTRREVEIVTLVAAGLTDRQIASQLHLSPRTVGNHLRKIYGKAEVTNRAALVSWAHSTGLLAGRR